MPKPLKPYQQDAVDERARIVVEIEKLRGHARSIMDAEDIPDRKRELFLASRQLVAMRKYNEILQHRIQLWDLGE